MFLGKPDSKKIKACELGKYFLKDVAYKAWQWFLPKTMIMYTSRIKHAIIEDMTWQITSSIDRGAWDS